MGKPNHSRTTIPSKWIRTDLWVETEVWYRWEMAENGRMQCGWWRVRNKRETERSQLPVSMPAVPIMQALPEMRPSWASKAWTRRCQLPPRNTFEVVRTGKTADHLQYLKIMNWVPRGYIVVHSSSPGTGLSQGFRPPFGGDMRSLAPKAVIWKAERAKNNGYNPPDGNEKVMALLVPTGKSVIDRNFLVTGTLPPGGATTWPIRALKPLSQSLQYFLLSITDPMDLCQITWRISGERHIECGFVMISSIAAMNPKAAYKQQNGPWYRNGARHGSEQPGL